MSAHNLTLAQMMQHRLITIADDTHVSSALLVARIEQVHHLPVLRGPTLVGLACTCDLHGAAPDSLVSEWMSQPVITLDARATAMDAALLMNRHAVGSVIATVEGHPKGIVTRGDLLRFDPDIENVLRHARCECCGLTRHLSSDDSGATLCTYCRPPGCSSEASCSAEGLAAAVAEGGASVAFDAGPLASLIREHELIGPLAEALASFAGRMLSREQDLAGERTVLEQFVRVFKDFADCVHHEKEETVLLPFLSRHGYAWSQGPLAEVRREHRQERYLIDVLCQAATCDDAWNLEDRRRIVATAVALAEFQRDHLLKENTTLFPAVLRGASARELEALRAELAAFDIGVARYMPCGELEELARGLIERHAAEPSVNSGKTAVGKTSRGVGSVPNETSI
jgi:hemerythrin-like domain-containing protein